MNAVTIFLYAMILPALLWRSVGSISSIISWDPSSLKSERKSFKTFDSPFSIKDNSILVLSKQLGPLFIFSIILCGKASDFDRIDVKSLGSSSEFSISWWACNFCLMQTVSENSFSKKNNYGIKKMNKFRSMIILIILHWNIAFYCVL